MSNKLHVVLLTVPSSYPAPPQYFPDTPIYRSFFEKKEAVYTGLDFNGLDGRNRIGMTSYLKITHPGVSKKLSEAATVFFSNWLDSVTPVFHKDVHPSVDILFFTTDKTGYAIEKVWFYEHVRPERSHEDTHYDGEFDSSTVTYPFAGMLRATERNLTAFTMASRIMEARNEPAMTADR